MGSKGVRILVILVCSVTREVLSSVQRLSSCCREEFLIRFINVSMKEWYNINPPILHLSIRLSNTLIYLCMGSLIRWFPNMTE